MHYETTNNAICAWVSLGDILVVDIDIHQAYSAVMMIIIICLCFKRITYLASATYLTYGPL